MVMENTDGPMEIILKDNTVRVKGTDSVFYELDK